MISIIIYFSIIIFIACLAYFKTKNSSDFIIGSRGFSPLTTALGVGASDMSGWLMMALPGVIYLNGISEIWYPLGLSIGAYINWKVVAKKIRKSTEYYGNSMTISRYLENRFKSRYVGYVSDVITSVFFIVYISAAMLGLTMLFSTFTNYEYKYCLLFSGFFVFFYTSLGGFLAINWMDVIQGILILCALLFVPITVFFGNENILETLQSSGVNITDPFYGMDFIAIISLLSWGLGYFGQPHILMRFMSISNSSVLPISMRICMSWMIICLLAASFVGLFGRVLFFSDGIIKSPETIFLLSAEKLFTPWISGVVLAAVIAAIMSTISAQLHAIAASISGNLLLSSKNKVFYTRFFMLIIIIISSIIIIDQNNTILNLVSLAWAGLGSSLGPIILFSIYCKKVDSKSAIYSMCIGSISVIIWSYLERYGGVFRLYSIIPGFTFSTITIIGYKLFYRLR